MPLWVARKVTLPAFTLHWAYKANTRSFIDMPFYGFLSPSLDTLYLTRILRHPIFIIQQIYEYFLT